MNVIRDKLVLDCLSWKDVNKDKRCKIKLNWITFTIIQNFSTRIFRIFFSLKN